MLTRNDLLGEGGTFVLSLKLGFCQEFFSQSSLFSLTALKNSWIFSKRFKWSKEHDILMLRDVNASEIWMTKPGSMERGDGWKQIADRLNKIESPNFECTARSVREHFQTLIEKRKVVNREEERASGISPEITEVDILLDELLEMFSSAAFDQQAAEKEKVDKRVEDVEKAKELRQQSLETLGETRKRRKEEAGDGKQKKVRNTKSVGNDTFAFLEKKMQEDAKIQREELELKKKEIEENARQRESIIEEQRRRDGEGLGGRNLERRLDLIEQHLQQQNQIMLQMLQNQQHHSQMLTVNSTR